MSTSTNTQALPTPDVLASIDREEIYDKDGNKHVLGELIAGKRTLLVFIRHFCSSPSPPHAEEADLAGCKNCQAYVRRIGEAVPPSALSAGSQGEGEV
jgi:predicted dithiol-disulfide oxidoreductase (DUF899 family)